MIKWRKIEENILSNTNSFQEFLTSKLAVSEGEYPAIVSCPSKEYLCITPSSNEKINPDTYYLLLCEYSGEKRRLLFEGELSENVITFNLSDETLWTTGFWCLYVAGKTKTKYFFSRLRTQKKIDWRYQKRVDGAFPESCLWQDKKRCLGILSEYTDNLSNQNLVILPDHRTSRIDLRWVPVEYSRFLMNGNIWHHAGSDRNKSCHFEFSIVMPIYKVEEWIDESIQSVLQQDIGFKKNVQLILVDDGSPDNSGAICDRYAAQYPKNIIVIHKENGGTSSARNAGKEKATGRYVNFLDPDDRLSSNTLTVVRDFFDTYYDRTDVVTIPMYFFDAQDGPHWQNYKFDKGSRVIDLWMEPTTSCMSSASSFYKLDIIKKVTFDSTLPASEDCKVNMEILSEKMSLGVVDECIYWYRKRTSSDSLIDTSFSKKPFYKEWFNNYALYTMNFYKKKYGFIPEFVQNMIMMDLQWRFIQEKIPDGLLSKREKEQYKKRIICLLKKISDSIIIKQKKLTVDLRIQILCMKYNVKPEIRYTYESAHLFCKGICLCDANNFVTHFDFIRIKKGNLILEGYMVLPGFPSDLNVEVYVLSNNDYYKCKLVERNFVNDNCFGKIRNVYSFYGELPIMNKYLGELIHMNLVIDGHLIINRNCTYGQFCPVSRTLSGQYCWIDKDMILRGFKQGIRLDPTTKERLEYEQSFTKGLQKKADAVFKRSVDDLFPVFPSTLTIEKYEEIVRLRHFAITAEKKKPIWLISDRLTTADDNGAALFSYLMKQKDLPAEIYFIIKKDCPDYDKMASIGPVLAFGSEEHLKIHLIADLVISSQSVDFVVTPFCKDTKYYGDRQYYRDLLYEQKYIFLQHGITINNVSKPLNRYHKNIAKFITSTSKEKQSILDYPYYYDADDIWLTGLPRFDLLYDDPKNQITIMPTWRNFLRGCTRQEFIESEFFTFYKSLIAAPILISALHEKKYRLCIKLHPELFVFRDLFEELGVTVFGEEEPYRKVYAESNLIITDYSSASLDFSYMRKPVIYCQFDFDSFFGKHYEAGYFDYKTDGFGPVTKTVDETVTQIVAMLKNDCHMESQYLDRCNAFFPVNDYHNCERVYQKLLEMNEKNQK